MLKGISNITRQIADNLRFFQGSEGTPIFVPDAIYPVYQTKDCGIITSIYDHQSVSATGDESFFTVPDNEFWTLHLLHAYVGGGTWTMGGAKLVAPTVENWDLNNSSTDPSKWSPSATKFIWLYKQATANPLVMDLNDPRPFRIPPKWSVTINVDAYTSTGSMFMFAIIGREIYK